MADAVLLRHPSSLQHDTGPHPERAERILAIERALESRGWLGYDVRSSPAATRAQLETVHPAAHVDAIEGLALRGGGAIDMDTVVSAGSYTAATHAAGGALAVVDALLGEEGARVAASLHRPPGHHAEAARAMGFCLFNNVALAARRALDVHGAGRVLVFDWDVHHGNGTNDIFRADPDVLFCSIHQSPLYPGTGPASDEGSGPGEGFTVNLPVPGGSGDDVWCAHVDRIVVDLARSYRPGLILLSAGFDAHLDDPLAGCAVTDAGFAAMAASMRAVASDLGVPLGLVLEGGYDLAALGRSVTAVLEVLAADGVVAAPAPVAHPLAEQARLRLAAGHWPALAL
jgi:acetoin utilization deacetylase AcuC-like enzyme